MSTEKKVISIAPIDLDGDLDQFIVKQDFDDGLGIKTTQLVVAMRRPRKDEWFIAHPSSKNPVYLHKPSQESGAARDEAYVLNAATARTIPEVVTPAYLVLCANRTGAAFFWPVRQPDPANANSWHVSALSALEIARKRFIRLVSDPGSGGYRVVETDEDLPKPDFGKLNERELLSTLLGKIGIKTPEHEVIRRILIGK